jgi:hypothetical protein
MGTKGGAQAAQMLRKGIIDCLGRGGPATLDIWVSIFFNKVGLQKVLLEADAKCTQDVFEDFILGFNQASPLFTMTDVGKGKDAADAKIRGEHSRQVYCSSYGALNPLLCVRVS